MHLNEITLRIENLSIQYAEVYGINRSADWALLKLTATGQSRDRGISADEQRQVVADVLGDVLGMCLVYANQLGIGPEVAIAEKWFRHEAAPAASAE